MGRIFWDLGQRPLATQSFAQAQRLYEDLAALASDDPEIQDGLAQALFRQSGYDRAIAIWEKLIRPDDPRYHADLAWAYNEAARACRDRQDWPRHLELLRKALAIRERLVRLRPNDWQAHQGLAASLYNIGEVMEGKDRGAEQLALWRTGPGGDGDGVPAPAGRSHDRLGPGLAAPEARRPGREDGGGRRGAGGPSA